MSAGNFHMNRVPPKMRDLARRLIEREMLTINSSQTPNQAAFNVCEKLRPHLATFTGIVGFRALLLRALALAGAEAHGLRALSVKTDGRLEGLDDFKTQVGQDAFSEGAVALLAQLLGLLVAFIGETLTLHLMSEVWPQLSFSDLEFGKESAHEKTE
jgi:hypothetical protein